MNSLSSQKCDASSSLFHNEYLGYDTRFNLFSQLQFEVFNTRNQLNKVTEENELLKKHVNELQNLLKEKMSETQTPSKQTDSIPIKEEIHLQEVILKPEIFLMNEKESSTITPISNLSSDHGNLESGGEEHSLPIRRRNGFKPRKDDGSVSSQDNSNNNSRPKAKHLWITYGRKIIEYAIAHSHGALKERIKECNKLISKRGFSEAFLLRKNDTEQEKEIKKQFGGLALQFLETEVENSFLISNYRDDLLSQKEKVLVWIKKQIREI